MDIDRGNLYLIPTPIGNNEPLEVLPLSVKKTVIELNEFVVENEKSARAFLKRIGIKTPQDKLRFHVLNKYTDPEELIHFLDACDMGNDIGLLSEAGCPAVADPGAEIVSMAHRKEIKVIPLVGPSSIVLALMASGMNGQSFAFNGYLPIEGKARKRAIVDLEKRSVRFDQTQLFIETPYRNKKILDDLLSYLHPDTKLCVALDLNSVDEEVITRRVADWKKEKKPEIDKRPAIFLIHGE
jgi:16S rRNA (cytidine1402-2'-O)-methyltransferase